MVLKSYVPPVNFQKYSAWTLSNRDYATTVLMVLNEEDHRLFTITRIHMTVSVIRYYAYLKLI
jgi:hypothetical protein